MRRFDREVTDPAEIAAIMAKCRVCHLGLTDENAPYLLPLNFGMEPDGMTLYFHGAMTGTKYALMEQHPYASFEMDRDHTLVMDDGKRQCTMCYESVIGYGTLEELTLEREKRHALDRIMAQYHQEAFAYDDAPVPRTRIFCLHVERRRAKRRKKSLSRSGI